MVSDCAVYVCRSLCIVAFMVALHALADTLFACCGKFKASFATAAVATAVVPLGGAPSPWPRPTVPAMALTVGATYSYGVAMARWAALYFDVFVRMLPRDGDIAEVASEDS